MAALNFSNIPSDHCVIFMAPNKQQEIHHPAFYEILSLNRRKSRRALHLFPQQTKVPKSLILLSCSTLKMRVHRCHVLSRFTLKIRPVRQNTVRISAGYDPEGRSGPTWPGRRPIGAHLSGRFPPETQYLHELLRSCIPRWTLLASTLCSSRALCGLI